MRKYTYVKYLDKDLTVNDYDQQKHYGEIHCPECGQAPMHLVKKQKSSYFASNRKQEHSIDCQHYAKILENKYLAKLANSKEIIDKEKLNFLIESGLNSAMRLLLKGKTQKNNEFNFSSVEKIPKTKNNIKNKNYKNENILRIHIKNINKDSEYIDNFVIIYGEASLSINNHQYTDKTTNEYYTRKQLIFKLLNKQTFSIFLSKTQTEYFNGTYGNIRFAVFGKLIQKKQFLNLNVMHTDHIKIDSK